MNKTNTRFLEALKASLEHKKVDWQEQITPKEWSALFQKASEHHILPLIYEAVYACPAAADYKNEMNPYRQTAIHHIITQTRKTSDFLLLYQTLLNADITPLVVKGLICRELYPNPDSRISGDEDILIPEEQFDLCHQTMLHAGMMPASPDEDFTQAYEVPYVKKGASLYIELHKHLFLPESDAYGDFNRYFEQIHSRAVKETIQGTDVYTLPPTDHLFYLICHAFKHFLHSGFGIRQVCDIVLYANAYGAKIDWIRLLTQCREIHAETFTAALFRIGEKYLTFSPEQAHYPAVWREIQTDESALLADLLDGGIYGDSNMSRKHSSNMTLHAVSASKQGKEEKHPFLKTLFPPLKNMVGRYPYLKSYPFLLPFAWILRIIKYQKESRRTPDNQAWDSMKIGNQRIELLKEYKIIP